MAHRDPSPETKRANATAQRVNLGVDGGTLNVPRDEIGELGLPDGHYHRLILPPEVIASAGVTVVNNITVARPVLSGLDRLKAWLTLPQRLGDGRRSNAYTRVGEYLLDPVDSPDEAYLRRPDRTRGEQPNRDIIVLAGLQPRKGYVAGEQTFLPSCTEGGELVLPAVGDYPDMTDTTRGALIDATTIDTSATDPERVRKAATGLYVVLHHHWAAQESPRYTYGMPDDPGVRREAVYH